MDFLSTEENNHTVTTTLEPKKQRSLLSFRSDDDDASLVDEAQVTLGRDRFQPLIYTLIQEM